jgi:hypothetical protein
LINSRTTFAQENNDNTKEDKQKVQVVSPETQWQESRDKHQELIKPVDELVLHYKI